MEDWGQVTNEFVNEIFWDCIVPLRRMYMEVCVPEGHMPDEVAMDDASQ